ncbi:transcriptional regulator [Salarchaeum japonicum]|uniref:Transcriptional regulator n=1 Tax=Salarchaeum japonicum TaxID=555573 RepID=A0AAV3T114_9EURY|nr:transcriptional regulator [Salarchaeum japonicum]
MNEVDDAILEFYSDLGEVGGKRVALPPTAVKRHLTDELESLDKSLSTYSRRMTKLEERGLLESPFEEGSYYRITDMGLAYLAGELDADDLAE